MSSSPPDDPNTNAALAAHRDASTGPDDAVPSGPTRLSFAQSPEKLHGKRKPVHHSTPDGRIVPPGRLRRGIGDGGATVSFPQFADDDDGDDTPTPAADGTPTPAADGTPAANADDTPAADVDRWLGSTLRELDDSVPASIKARSVRTTAEKNKIACVKHRDIFKWARPTTFGKHRVKEYDEGFDFRQME